MKKIAALLLSAVCVLGLVACGGDSKPADNKGGNTAGSSDKGYVFTANGTEVVIDAEAEAILNGLGAPNGDPVITPSCAFEGEDKSYTYSGFVVDTYPDENKTDRISCVTLTDDTVKTPEGISLGASKADVEGAYGSDYTDNNGSLIYKKGNMKLIFIIKDDMVTSIQYANTQLDN